MNKFLFAEDFLLVWKEEILSSQVTRMLLQKDLLGKSVLIFAQVGDR